MLNRDLVLDDDNDEEDFRFRYYNESEWYKGIKSG